MSTSRWAILLLLALSFPLTVFPQTEISQADAPRADAHEPVRWLRDYLQIDTTNPPGNEDQGAAFLAGILEREGIESRFLASPEGRISLYARVQSPSSRGRAIALVHHIDVVPADDSWQVEPFSGRRFRSSIWGRGAIDAKSLGIAQLAALISCRRDGIPFERDVIYLAVADEERGGAQGAGWILEEYPDLFQGLEGVLNEGGSNRVSNDHLLWWGIEVAQKRPLWLKVTASGRGGHGSGWNPRSPTHQLIEGLAGVLRRPLRYRVTPAVRQFLGAVAEVEGGANAEMSERLDEIIRPDGPTQPLPPGMPLFFLDTIQVTQLANGTQGPNVVPPEASAYIDMRLLPDTDSAALLAEIREILGVELEVEVLLHAPEAPISPTEHPVFQALDEVLSVRAPVVPLFISGTTDSRYFRQRGIPAYGLQPFVMNSPDLRGIHAVDEHIPVASFLRGIETLRRILIAYAG